MNARWCGNLEDSTLASFPAPIFLGNSFPLGWYTMTVIKPLFIGFRVKMVIETPYSTRCESIVAHARAEICSVSDCLAEAPPDWEKRWDFNKAWCYNTEDQALATVPAGHRHNYELFAYRMFPIEFNTEGRRELALPDEFALADHPIAQEPVLRDYKHIGYDIAGGSIEVVMGFNCSPLSCNNMSNEYPVNRFWLIDDLEMALRVADDFGRTEPEPGPYYLYEVLRKRSDRWHL